MESAKSLVRMVVRIFYTPKQILIVDALMVHGVLHPEELAELLNCQQKDIRRIAGPLRSAKLISIASRAEVKAGSTRSVSREYYYIPIHLAVDAIKYRIAKVQQRVKELYNKDLKTKDWRCPRCKAEYETFEVLGRGAEADSFECSRCGNTLVATEQSLIPDAGHDKFVRLMKQIDPIMRVLEKIDGMPVADNNFEEDWEKRIPISKRSDWYQIRGVNGTSMVRRGPDMVKASDLDIQIRTEGETDAAEEAKKEQRRAELAKQNQLPDWHAGTTYGKEAESRKTDGGTSGNNLAVKAEGSEDKKFDATMQDDMAAYLAQIDKEREAEEEKAAQEDAESDDGDDGDEFEDVSTAATPIPTGTPTSSQQTSTGVKRERDDDSGISSDANTPAAYDSERDSKRIKTEGSTSAPKLEESDDDEDFEDAL